MNHTPNAEIANARQCKCGNRPFPEWENHQLPFKGYKIGVGKPADPLMEVVLRCRDGIYNRTMVLRRENRAPVKNQWPGIKRLKH